MTTDVKWRQGGWTTVAGHAAHDLIVLNVVPHWVAKTLTNPIFPIVNEDISGRLQSPAML